MSSTAYTYAVSQLEWWQKLPPSNLIERDDRIRYRHALYLMVHQVAAVLLSLNRQPDQMYFPSRLSDARHLFDRLFISPATTGYRLEQIISIPDPYEAWGLASGLIQDVLKLAKGDKAGHSVEIPATKQQDPERLMSLAQAVAERCRMLPGIDAVALSGSLARGMADASSDVDLSVYCRAYPPDQERQMLLSSMPGTRDILVEHACDTIWIEDTLVHIRYWLTHDVTDMIARVPDPPEDFTLAEDLQICWPLLDPAGHLQHWKMKLQVLPVELINTLVAGARQRFQDFTMQWHQAGGQQDLIHLYCLANQAIHDWLRILFALNHRFLSSPRWTHKTVQTFSIVPEDVESRLFEVVGPIDGDFKERWRTMEDLWEAIER